MLLLPAEIVALLAHFALLFSLRVGRHVPVLVVGASVPISGENAVPDRGRSGCVFQLSRVTLFSRLVGMGTRPSIFCGSWWSTC